VVFSCYFLEPIEVVGINVKNPDKQQFSENHLCGRSGGSKKITCPGKSECIITLVKHC